MSVEDSEARRFEPNIRLSFPEADLGSNINPRVVFFRVFPKFRTSCLKNRAHSMHLKTILRVSLELLWKLLCSHRNIFSSEIEDFVEAHPYKRCAILRWRVLLLSYGFHMASCSIYIPNTYEKDEI